MSQPDWDALLSLETDDPVGMMEWFDALWRAIKGRDSTVLAGMFRSGRIPPAELAPLVAQVLDRDRLTQPPGQPPKITPLYAITIRRGYARLIQEGLSNADAIGELAEAFGVSEKTIERVLRQNM